MKLDSERDTLKLMIPVKAKQAIRQLAIAKHTSMNNIAYQLLDAQLNRKPGLIAQIADNLNQFQSVEEILGNYRQVISAYTTLTLVPNTNRDLYLEKSECFIKSAQQFVHNFKRHHGV